ncbi:MAG: hypothetical protein DRO14_04325 [Thermoprotei archaeon]|nr:MAG: hypothetical protein DRO14_04325 [Thermoprotei archaeon]
MKRLVVYVGYDYRSASLVRRVMNLREFFDDVRIIYVPDYDDKVLEDLSVPTVVVEEVPA